MLLTLFMELKLVFVVSLNMFSFLLKGGAERDVLRVWPCCPSFHCTGGKV